MMKKKGPNVVMPDGSRVGLKDIGKVKPTPKPRKNIPPAPLRETPAQYEARLRAALEAEKKSSKKRVK
jgi:hypothetical protein